MNQICLLFLFSYPRYHVRYSFVPCKYTPGSYHSSISFFHLCVSIPNCCCHRKLITAQENSWRCVFLSWAQLWKAALLRQKEEGTVDQEDPTSRPLQSWADAPAACDNVTDRKSRRDQQKPQTWLGKKNQHTLCPVMSWHKSLLYFLLWPGLWSPLLITIKSLCLF